MIMGERESFRSHFESAKSKPVDVLKASPNQNWVSKEEKHYTPEDWNLKIHPSLEEKNHLNQTIIFRFYVDFRGV